MDNIKSLIKGLYNTNDFKISKLSDARTTDAYRVEFQDRSIVVKVAYDEGDIERFKGKKEVTTLGLIKSISPYLPSPDIEFYIDNQTNFPGYIVALKVLPGKVLKGKEFSEVALKDENIEALTDYMNQYHSFKISEVTDFATFNAASFDKYIEKYQKKFLQSIPKKFKMNNEIEELVTVKKYFHDHPLSLIHRDIKYNNLLFNEGKISGIIDWETAFTAPIAFDFAHVTSLSHIYGYTSWIEKLIDRYIEKYKVKSLKNDIRVAEKFCHLRWLSRIFDHSSEVGNRICIETGEEEIEYHRRKINELKK